MLVVLLEVGCELVTMMIAVVVMRDGGCGGGCSCGDFCGGCWGGGDEVC